MKIQELSKLSIKELQEKADECLAKNEDPNVSDWDKANYITQAQLYIGEINRRSDDHHARRDFWMEIAVIVLIGAELLMGYGFHRSEAKQAEKQAAVLDQMLKSAKDTATILTGVRTSQEASLDTQKHTLDNIITMNTALQDAMGLNYAVALEITFDSGAVRINFVNKGKTNLYLWGIKVDGNVALEKEPRLITPQGAYFISAADLRKQISETLPKGTGRLIPFDVYVKTTKGKPYVINNYLAVSWDADVLKINCQTTSVKSESW